MPDRRVETWESKLYKADLEELSLYAEEDQNVIVCLSPMSRNVLLDMVGFSLRWARRWRANKNSPPGSVPEDVILQIVEQIERELIMALGCGDDLTRIAVAIESLDSKAGEALEFVDSQYISLSEFIDFLGLAGLDKFKPWLDAAGEIVELLNVIPDVNIRVPMGGMIAGGLQFFTNMGFRNRLENINKSLQTIALGQAGPGIQDAISALLTLVPDSLETVVDAVAGPVDEIVTTAGIDLVTLLSRNYMTARTNDVARALNGGDYDIFGDSNVVEAINSLEETLHDDTDQTQLFIGDVAATLDEHLAQIANQIARLADRPECGCPAGGTEGDAPATDNPIEPGDDGYPNQSDVDAYRCKAAYLTWETLRSVWFKMAANSDVEITGMGISGVLGVLVFALTVSGIGLPIAAIAGLMVALAGKIIQVVAFQSTDIVNFFDERQEEIVCAFFTAPNEEAARIAFQAVMDDYGLLTILEEEALILMLPNNVLNRVYAEDIRVTEAPDPEYDCTGCLSAVECPFVVLVGSADLLRYDGATVTFSSADLGGGVHSLLVYTEVDCLSNWCVRFPTLPEGLVCPNPTNFTRRLNKTSNGVQHYHDIGYENASPDCFFPVGQIMPISGFSIANDAAFTLELQILAPSVSVDSEPPEASTDCE